MPTNASVSFEMRQPIFDEHPDPGVCDSSASEAYAAVIRRIAGQIEGIEHVHEVLSMHVGPQSILVAMTLELSSGPTRRHAIDQLEARLRRSDPRIRRIFVRVRKSEHLDD